MNIEIRTELLRITTWTGLQLNIPRVGEHINLNTMGKMRTFFITSVLWNAKEDITITVEEV